ncbi:putative pumilio homolog 8, chloroplastic [Telopea speciosissima]|uniref:putative pumilio homolog 8, chloroplastic n=1 Tax=Telopea speciosissima TaxID=54955 RepID=UPI001CC75741|nr:putative pumilio homolog 8, chloroplastic [Telopea speciosissima]
MGGGTEQDFDEIDFILGAIPEATSENTHPEESGHLNSSVNLEMNRLEEGDRKCSPPATFTKFYHASQAANPGSNSAFYTGLSFERPRAACMNSSQSSSDESPQANGNMDGGKLTVRSYCQSPVKNIDREDSNLPDDQSLTSAFVELGFKDGVALESPSPQLVNYNTLQSCTFVHEGQYPNCLKNPHSRLDSGVVAVPYPSSPNTLNGMNLVTAASNGVDRLNAEMNGQRSTNFLKLNVQELEKQKPGSGQPLENLSGALGEQLQSHPMYSAAMPLAPGMHSLQVLSSVPVPGVEFPMMPYQHQYFVETQSPLPYMQPQQMGRSPLTWRHMEEERYCRMRQHYLYSQQLRNQGSEAHLSMQANANEGLGPMTRNLRQPYFEMPISHQLEQSNRDAFWNNAAARRGFNSSNPTLMSNGVCHYYTRGFCGRGDGCPFAHGQKQTSASSLGGNPPALAAKDIEAVQVMDKVGKHSFPEKILTRSHGLNSIRAIKPGSDGGRDSLNHSNANGRTLSNGHFHHHPSILNAGSFQLDGRNSRCSSPDAADIRNNNLRSLPQRYNSMDEVTGRIYLMAKDQHGCRFLQRKFSEGTAEDVEKIFLEIIGHIVELMTDPFGNYLVQKLLEVCDGDQRMQIIHAITRKPGDLVRISCDMHGTRAVQKVIETLKTPEQFSMIVSSLKPGIVLLIKDMNGNHVAQRCLQYLIPEYSEFLFQAAVTHCVELATDRHGCCVLQKCLGHSDGEHRQRLISEITSNALSLSQDRFGNYVVQFVFELRIPWATIDLLDQLEGNYGYLSMQKYSSNVVEKCLKYAGEEGCPRIIQELINYSRLDQILLDPYGNYVIQAALNQSKGVLHSALVEAIRPHVPALRTSPYGKKVLSSNSLKKVPEDLVKLCNKE